MLLHGFKLSDEFAWVCKGYPNRLSELPKKNQKKKNSIGDLKSVFGPDTMFQRLVKAVVMGRPATPALQLSIPQTSEKE